MLYIYRMYSVVVDTRVGQWVLVQVKGECRCGWGGGLTRFEGKFLLMDVGTVPVKEPVQGAE